MRLLKLAEINNKYKIKKAVEKLDDNVVLTDEQKTCIKEIFNSQVAVITGGPGTGKTTIVKGILKTLEMVLHVISACFFLVIAILVRKQIAKNTISNISRCLL